MALKQRMLENWNTDQKGSRSIFPRRDFVGRVLSTLTVLLLMAGFCADSSAQEEERWNEISSELCTCMQRDDLDAFREVIFRHEVDFLADFFKIRCPATGAFEGGDLFRAAAHTASNTVGRHLVLYLNQEVGRDQMNEYFNNIDPRDGMTLLDWLRVQADSMLGSGPSLSTTRERYILMMGNFRQLGAKYACEIFPDIPCEETPEEWLEKNGG